MLHARFEGRTVNPDARNTIVVVALIASMTLGAWILLELEPPSPGWSSAALLTADDGSQIESVVVHYLLDGMPFVAADYEGVVYPDGTVDEWRPRGSQAHVLIVGDAGAELAAPQVRTLLAILGNIGQGLRGNGPFVSLGPTCDPDAETLLAGQAEQLASLLIRKNLVR